MTTQKGRETEQTGHIPPVYERTFLFVFEENLAQIHKIFFMFLLASVAYFSLPRRATSALALSFFLDSDGLHLSNLWYLVFQVCSSQSALQ